MITITVAAVPFIVACAIFLVYFCEVCRENGDTVLLPFIGLGISAVVYFAGYGLSMALGAV